MRTTKAEKILLLGVDGLDPRLTRKYVDMGLMPNVKTLIERGACREDLVLLGGHPTVTPPMWTTLATGCYANVHGITAFHGQDPENLDVLIYNLDSRRCKAEQLWNVFAEAGKKTLVWHWPGSSWPPTSNSENLLVVDGSSPGSVGMSNCQKESDFLVTANEKFEGVTLMPKAASSAVAPCVIEDLDVPTDNVVGIDVGEFNSGKPMTNWLFGEDDGARSFTGSPLDVSKSYIHPATGWNNAPADAKEFIMLMSEGLLRRPCLILKNENGIYDKVAIYKSKKAENPIVVLENRKMVGQIVDECIKNDVKYNVIRNMEVLDLAEDGSSVRMYVSAAMDIQNDTVWHPKSLFKTITEKIGYPTPTSLVGSQDPELINECMLNSWKITADWQADSIKYLIDNENVEIVFSHFHNVDMQSHVFIRFMSENETKTGHWKNKIPATEYQKFMEDVYKQVDYYVGKFIHYLDEGWLIALFSDHAQVCSTHVPPFLGDSGLNCVLMEELGYTVLKRDENGERIKEVDWEKTRAIANRECNIYINLKGRNKTGIVDPEDKYELEEQIITDLYGYKDPVTGKRVVACALRNKDAVLFGYGGPECGDIIYWNAEGYTYDHADSLSTTLGDADTSVSPAFIIAGPGIKQGYTDRVIRQIDFAPTVAVLGGVRMPEQCEGAPIYQILLEAY